MLLQEVLTQSDVVQEPVLSDKPLLSGIAVPADLPSQAKPPPLLSRVRVLFSVDSHITSAETLFLEGRHYNSHYCACANSMFTSFVHLTTLASCRIARIIN